MVPPAQRSELSSRRFLLHLLCLLYLCQIRPGILTLGYETDTQTRHMLVMEYPAKTVLYHDNLQFHAFRIMAPFLQRLCSNQPGPGYCHPVWTRWFSVLVDWWFGHG